MSTGKFLGGLLLGGLVGGAIGLLFAPRSGRETREMIKDELNHRWDDTTDAVKQRTNAIGQEVTHRVDDLKHKAQEIAEDLERAGRSAVESGRQAWDKVTAIGPRGEEKPAPMTD